MLLVTNKLTTQALTNSINCNLLQLRSLKYVPIETNNKIVVGHKMTQVIEKKRIVFAKKEEIRRKLQSVRNPNNLIIKCRNPDFDHYNHQRYKDDSIERYFASKGWRNSAKKGDFFTINAFGPHPALEDYKCA